MAKRNWEGGIGVRKRIRDTSKLITWYYSPKDAVNNKEIKESADDLKPEELRSPDYLSFFRKMIKEVKIYGTSVFCESELLLLNSFTNLDDECQSLFIRLFMRKHKWLDINSINYPEVPNLLKSANILLSSSFLRGSQACEIFQDLDSIYDFLFSLKLEQLQYLETHLRALLIKTTGDDAVDLEIEKPVLRVFKEYTKFSCFKKDLLHLFNVLKQPESNSRKSRLIGLNAEILVFLKSLFEKNNQVDKIPELIPFDFPGFLKLADSPMALFSRINRIYCFFSSESAISDYANDFSNHLTLVDFQVSIESYKIFNSYEDSIAMDSVFCFQLLIENLSLYKANFENLLLISQTLSEIYLRNFSLSFEDFLNSYQNFHEIDWKIEYSSQERWARVLHLALQQIQKSKDWETCIKILTSLLSHPYYYIKRGHWWERLAIITSSHLKQGKQALAVVKLGLTDPYLKTGKRLKLESRRETLEFGRTRSKKQQLFNYSHPLFQEVKIEGQAVTIDGKLRYLHNCNPVTVEEFVLEHYKSAGWTGFHSENTILTSIFGVLMWEYLYHDLPFVFQTSVQKAPLDYRSEDFYKKRKEIFKKLKNHQKTSELSEIFLKNFEKYRNQGSLFVNWNILELWGLDFLLKVVKTLGPSLFPVLKSLSKDYRHHSSGMPDLLLLKENKVKLVEVKSQNDRLSDQQKMWIKLLNTSCITVEVVHVLNSK
jgi:Fanconi-associated nuclease 1